MKQPHIGVHGTETDEDGEFQIRTVPAGQIRVNRRVKMEGSAGWTNAKIKDFECVGAAE